MNFFQRQHQARRKTFFLVASFLAASIAIIVVIDVVVLLFLGTRTGGGFGAQLAANAGLVLTASVLTALVILGGSAYKIASLNSGGGAVARSLGAQPVPAEPGDFPRRQLRNVVEEVAIAAGMPVPEIYVLEQEMAINAFAAGNTPSDAAIAVTRGAMERLDRAELQGVIAHEFSHVANGDMRLNLKLMGWVFGLLLLTLAGRLMLYGGAGHRKGNAMALVGLALVLAGLVGLVAGRLIKAAVSRERERLADASAVQFTRNPTGLAGALKKIGGFEAGSKLNHTDAEEVSHMLFAQSLSGWFSGLFATHPPLAERIQALEPQFDAGGVETAATVAGARGPGGSPSQAALAPEAMVAAAGQPAAEHLPAGAALRDYLPEDLRRAARDSDGARLLILALMLDLEENVRAHQQPLLDRALDAQSRRTVETRARALQTLGPAARLPLLELAWPALKTLPPEALRDLTDLAAALAHADGRVSVREYALSRSLRVLVEDLGGDRSGGRIKLNRVRPELEVVFSVLALAGHDTEEKARRAFTAGTRHLLGSDAPAFGRPQQWQQSMDHALDRLDALAPLVQEKLIEGLAITCAHDNRLTVPEAELLRAVCVSLHCPLPPLPLAA